RQFQAEGVFPIDAGADGLGRLPVGQVLDELKDGDQGEPPGGLGGSAAAGVEGGEVLVSEDGAQFVAQVEIGVAVGEGGASDPGGVIGDGDGQLSAQRHRALQRQCAGEWCEGFWRGSLPWDGISRRVKFEELWAAGLTQSESKNHFQWHFTRPTARQSDLPTVSRVRENPFWMPITRLRNSNKTPDDQTK